MCTLGRLRECSRRTKELRSKTVRQEVEIASGVLNPAERRAIASRRTRSVALSPNLAKGDSREEAANGSRSGRAGRVLVPLSVVIVARSAIRLLFSLNASSYSCASVVKRAATTGHLSVHQFLSLISSSRGRLGTGPRELCGGRIVCCKL